MAIPLSDIRNLQLYVRSVIQRAQHHANGVEQIVLALAGAILWRSRSLEVHAGVRDRMGTVLWANINGRRYAFAYNHKTGRIEMRRGSQQGEVLHEFCNETSLDRLMEAFAEL